jgi:hypothetical protein
LRGRFFWPNVGGCARTVLLIQGFDCHRCGS